MIMAGLGFRNVNEMIGRVDALEFDAAIEHWKAEGVDLSKILTKAIEPHDCLGVYRLHDQNHGLDKSLDHHLIKLAKPAIREGKRVRATMPIRNINRVVGAMLSNQIIKHVGSQMLPEDAIRFKFTGSAGQSFGAWLAKGVTLEVEGDASPYFS